MAIKFLLIAGLYLFLWRILCVLRRDLKETNSKGSPRPPTPSKLVVIGEDNAEGEEVYLTKPRFLLGRDGSCDLILKDEYASKIHARIILQRRGVWLEDLHSTNGTYINGELVTAKVMLKDGDLVKVGATILRFRE
jgi:pSer/pThr/pTyr-binding forkhead associated (FHA) protein